MRVAVLIYDRFTALDAIGPYEVLGQIPGVTLQFVAEEKRIYRADTGALALSVEHTLAEVPDPDIVLIPGGPGSSSARDNEVLLDWIRGTVPTAKWICSVCTGSELLAAAGLLDGLNATTHWTRTHVLETYNVTPVQQRIVRNGRVVTAAGVSSGIDMAIQVVAWQFGDLFAQAMQLAIEYDPEPPFVFKDIPDEARQLVLASSSA